MRILRWVEETSIGTTVVVFSPSGTCPLVHRYFVASVCVCEYDGTESLGYIYVYVKCFTTELHL